MLSRQWAAPFWAVALMLTVAPGLAGQSAEAQAVNPQSWRSAVEGDGLWLMEPYQSEFVSRGTWARFNNIEATQMASTGDVVPIPIEFQVAFDPAWGGGPHRVYAEILMKVDGKLIFAERIPEAGYWPEDALQVTAHRTALLGIGDAPADGELTIELLGILYDDGQESQLGSDNLPAYEGTVYQGHPYFGGSRFTGTSVLKETRRVQHLRIDNPFILDNLALATTGTCPGPAEVRFVLRTAFGGQSTLHPKAIEVRVAGLEDQDGWDWSPAMGTFTMGPNDHRALEYTGVLRGAEPCEVYPYSADVTVTASGKYNVIPSSNWSGDIQSTMRQYWENRTWRSRFTIGAGSQAKPMPLQISASCQGEGTDCPDALAPTAADEDSARRFTTTERAPRRHDGPLQKADELTIYLPAGALEGETIRGTVVARGESMAGLSPEALGQITVNNEPVKPFERPIKNEDNSAAAQQFTATLTNGGGIAQAALSTAKGPVPLTTVTVMAEESFPSVGTGVITANVPDVWSWNPPGTALWTPGSNATSVLAPLPADAYKPAQDWNDPTAPLITGLAGGPRMLVTLSDEEVRAAVAASPYMATGFLDSLAERYHAWAADPYKDAGAIARGTAPQYINPGSYFTYVGPTPSAGGPYTAQNSQLKRDDAPSYGAGWDPNKPTLENIVLMDPQTGAVVEKLPILSQSSIMATGYIPENVTPGNYNVGLETNDGQVVKTNRRTVALEMMSENDKVVERGTQGMIQLRIDGHGNGKEKEQDEEKDGKQLRPELRFFWNSLQMLPGDWASIGYSPRRGSFLNRFSGTRRPDADQQQQQQQGRQSRNQDQDKLWKKEKKQPEMFVTVFNLTPGIIRFADGRDVVTMPVYSDTTELQIAFTGVQTGAYAVRIQVEEPDFSALDPDRLRNLNPEENPLMKLATNGWDESILDGYDLPMGK